MNEHNKYLTFKNKPPGSKICIIVNSILLWKMNKKRIFILKQYAITYKKPHKSSHKF